MSFSLHPELAKKIFLLDLPLSTLFLENEKNYPWLILVPRRAYCSRLVDLEFEDQVQLLKELNLLQNGLQTLFPLKQINIAALGNKTPQLHIHVIGRKETDPAWPGTVWDHPVRSSYTEEQKEEMVLKFRKEFKTAR